MIKSIYSSLGAGLDETTYVKNSMATARREAPIFDVYSDSDESSCDNLDLIINALSQLQVKSCSGQRPVELIDNLREVASIDDLPYQHGTPLTPIRTTGSGGTELVDYGSDLNSYTPERQISVIIHNQQDPDALRQHDPNKTPDQISEDELTINAPLDVDEARRIARRRKNQRREERRVRAAERACINLCDLNRDFDNATDAIFNTPITAMAEATIRLMQLPRNPETERII